jgi:hypothetical protein
MEKSELSLEDLILNRIKDGNSTVFEIMSIARKYDVQIIDVSRTLRMLIDKNAISMSGNKFIINE